MIASSGSKRRVAILGSTGSIGTQALDVIARHPDRFSVVALAAGRNLERLREQAELFHPAITACAADGPAGLHRVAAESGADVVLAATDGAVAFDAVFAAVDRGIDVAVANKELVVAAGELLMAHAKRSGARILPVDSEHSAIFQCLAGEDPAGVAAIVLTASGGPFLRASAHEIAEATVAQALAHPTWQMGTKNTIDSATMMNKGLEIIEASRLFGMPGDRLHILVHPTSIAHGFVIFTDGSIKAQLCPPDMRVPIGYALAYPARLPGLAPAGGPRSSRARSREAPPMTSDELDPLKALGGKPDLDRVDLHFERPDPLRFPCVHLAYEALARGGVMPAVLSAANEVAVRAFVEGKIRFGRIATVIEAAMEATAQRSPTLDGIREADREARTAASRTVGDFISQC
jgi:1-deoxy-D-xylulose-5-phosphate reductoisomerase